MNYHHAYCFFCETQKCRTIAALIERCYDVRCIFPEMIQRKWTKGICEEKKHSWLPGYVFVYSNVPLDKPLRIPGIIRILGNGELKDSDLDFASMLYDRNGIMGTIQLVEVGQHCTISDPMWQKIKGKVIKIDRGRKRCCVQFTFDTVQRNVGLGYDLIQTDQESSFY